MHMAVTRGVLTLLSRIGLSAVFRDSCLWLWLWAAPHRTAA